MIGQCVAIGSHWRGQLCPQGMVQPLAATQGAGEVEVRLAGEGKAPSDDERAMLGNAQGLRKYCVNTVLGEHPDSCKPASRNSVSGMWEEGGGKDQVIRENEVYASLGVRQWWKCQLPVKVRASRGKDRDAGCVFEFD